MGKHCISGHSTAQELARDEYLGVVVTALHKAEGAVQAQYLRLEVIEYLAKHISALAYTDNSVLDKLGYRRVVAALITLLASAFSRKLFG